MIIVSELFLLSRFDSGFSFIVIEFFLGRLVKMLFVSSLVMLRATTALFSMIGWFIKDFAW